ncbi:MAG: hypothetical protein FJ096_17615 [Deltaproteobacteria bacterium]|nr:hypothetical protein [Deltaproteobacteria bacterium]
MKAFLVLQLLLAFGLLVVAWRLLVRAWAATWIVRVARARPEQPLATLQAGPLETRGTLRTSAPVFAAEGEPCVAVSIRLTNSWRTRGLRQSSSHSVSQRARFVADSAELVDGATVVMLDLTDVAASGTTRRIELPAQEFRDRYPRYEWLVSWRASQVVLVEERLEVGIDARVWGARIEGESADASAYRMAGDTTRWLRGDKQRGLVIAPASDGDLGRRALPPALGLAFGGLACASYALWLLWGLVVVWR